MKEGLLEALVGVGGTILGAVITIIVTWKIHKDNKRLRIKLANYSERVKLHQEGMNMCWGLYKALEGGAGSKSVADAIQECTDFIAKHSIPLGSDVKKEFENFINKAKAFVSTAPPQKAPSVLDLISSYEATRNELMEGVSLE